MSVFAEFHSVTFPATGFLAAAIPDLRPPENPIPPPFLEQHEASASFGGVLLLVFLALIIWWWRHPRKRSGLPPAEVVRHKLKPLASLPENGALAGQVSRILRNYLSAVLPTLPHAELTAEEIAGQLPVVAPWLGEDLIGKIIGLLRECNRLKFSNAPVTTPANLVTRAWQAVERTEAARELEGRRVAAETAAEGTVKT